MPKIVAIEEYKESIPDEVYQEHVDMPQLAELGELIQKLGGQVLAGKTTTVMGSSTTTRGAVFVFPDEEVFNEVAGSEVAKAVLADAVRIAGGEGNFCLLKMEVSIQI